MRPFITGKLSKNPENYNRGLLGANCFDVTDVETGIPFQYEITRFYVLDDRQDLSANIWWQIEHYKDFIGPNTIPFADDGLKQIYYMKWVNDVPQVWYLTYLDLEKPEAQLVMESFDKLLEALYHRINPSDSLHSLDEERPTVDDSESKKSFYSCYFEIKLDDRYFGKSRQQHNRIGNEHLLAKLKSLNESGLQLCKEITNDKLIDSITRAKTESPPNFTWEHCSSSTANGQLGVMRLVSDDQHNPKSEFWDAFHIDHGHRGGYHEWALPAGAPPENNKKPIPQTIKIQTLTEDQLPNFFKIAVLANRHDQFIELLQRARVICPPLIVQEMLTRSYFIGKQEKLTSLLHIAVKYGHPPLIKDILYNGKDISKFLAIQDSKGCTVAHIAAENNRHHILRDLRILGTDLSIKNYKHETVADIVQSRKFIACLPYGSPSTAGQAFNPHHGAPDTTLLALAPSKTFKELFGKPLNPRPIEPSKTFRELMGRPAESKFDKPFDKTKAAVISPVLPATQKFNNEFYGRATEIKIDPSLIVKPVSSQPLESRQGGLKTYQTTQQLGTQQRAQQEAQQRAQQAAAAQRAQEEEAQQRALQRIQQVRSQQITQQRIQKETELRGEQQRTQKEDQQRALLRIQQARALQITQQSVLQDTQQRAQQAASVQRTQQEAQKQRALQRAQQESQQRAQQQRAQQEHVQKTTQQRSQQDLVQIGSQQRVQLVTQQRIQQIAQLQRTQQIVDVNRTQQRSQQMMQQQRAQQVAQQRAQQYRNNSELNNYPSRWCSNVHNK